MTVKQINEKIQALIEANPRMRGWPKHKKRYKNLSAQFNGDLSRVTAEQDKKFLEWFEPLQKVRQEIKTLKELKESFQRPPAPKPSKAPASGKTGMSDMMTIEGINAQIQALITANPRMQSWPKHKKRYKALCEQFADDLSRVTAEQDKKFLEWFEPLQKVRMEIQTLKDIKERLRLQPRPSRAMVEAGRLRRKQNLERQPAAGQQKHRGFTGGFFKHEAQRGIYLKKR